MLGQLTNPTLTYRVLGAFAFCICASSLLLGQGRAQRLLSFIPIKKYQKSQRIEDVLKISNDDLSFRRLPESNGYSAYQQYYLDIPIEGAEIRVHDRSGHALITGVSYDVLDDVDLESTMSYAQVLRQSGINDNLIRLSEGKVIHVDHHGITRLAYKIRCHSIDYATHFVIYMDAMTGREIDRRQRVYHHEARAMSLHDDTVLIDVTMIDSTELLMSDMTSVMELDHSKKMSQAYTVALDSQDRRTAVQAYYGVEQSHDFYKNKHGRSSYDDLHSQVTAYINYGDGYTNGFWNGRDLVLGDGDGYNYGPIVSLDVIGHEYTHGVIDHTADLRYSGESGALNESFADIFGEMIEYHSRGTNDWYLGKDVGLHNRLIFRSMRAPKGAGHPDTYGGQHWRDPHCGSPSIYNDRCGIHTNSGVQNKWFYILAVGETGTNDLGNSYDVVAIGREAAMAITYRSLSTYLFSDAAYMDARQGSIYAAIDLYGEGSVEHISTVEAWYAVGVGDRYIEETATGAEHESQDTLVEAFIMDTLRLDVQVVDVSWDRATVSWTSVDEASVYQVSWDSISYITEDTVYSLVDLAANVDYSVRIDAWADSILVSDTIGIQTIDRPRAAEFCPHVSYDFDNDLETWTHAGSADWRGRYKKVNGALRLKGGTDGGIAETPLIELYGTDVELTMDIYAWSMELSDQVTIEYSEDDVSWQVLDALSTRDDLKNRYVKKLSWQLSLMNPSIKLRITNQGNSRSDHIYIDHLSIASRCPQTAFVDMGLPISKVYPNPTADRASLLLEEPAEGVNVYSMTGQLIKYWADVSVGNLSIGKLPHAGVYVIEVIYGDHTQYLHVVRR